MLPLCACVHDRVMTDMDDWEITEEKIMTHAPRVRALLVARLEALWGVGQAQIAGAGESGRPVDPRWAELCLRVAREYAGLYRLAKPAPVSEDEEGPAGLTDPRQHVLDTLQEIKAREESREKGAGGTA